MWVSRHVGLRGSNLEFSMAMIPTALYPSLLYISIHVYTSFMWSPASGQVDTIYSRYGTRRSPPSPPLRLPSDPHPRRFLRTPCRALALLVCYPGSTFQATNDRRLQTNEQTLSESVVKGRNALENRILSVGVSSKIWAIMAR